MYGVSTYTMCIIYIMHIHLYTNILSYSHVHIISTEDTWMSDLLSRIKLLAEGSRVASEVCLCVLLYMCGVLNKGCDQE